MHKLRLNENQFNTLVLKCVKKALSENKTLLKEGAGAGYDVELKGLTAHNISYQIKGDTVLVKAKITPSIVDWSARDYYDGIDSNGNDEYGLYYDDVDKQVEGGWISVAIDESIVSYGCNNYGGMTDENIQYCLRNIFSDFSIKFMYGSGYVHSDLPSPSFTIKNCDIVIWFGGEETYNGEVSITAPNIIDNINWFFAHKDELGEVEEEE